MIHQSDYSTLSVFLKKFIILPQKINILHIFAYFDQSDNFEAAMTDGHFYFSDMENITPL
jgi:hypothetical protein